MPTRSPQGYRFYTYGDASLLLPVSAGAHEPMTASPSPSPPPTARRAPATIAHARAAKSARPPSCRSAPPRRSRRCARPRCARRGADIILGNTYHLMLRPGAERVARLGGLHASWAGTGPILTDSGGYQVMSLSALTKVSEEGVAFASHLDGIAAPAHARAVDGDPAPARLGHRHGVRRTGPTTDAGRGAGAQAMERSMRWAERSRDGVRRGRRHARCRAVRHPAGRARRGVAPGIGRGADRRSASTAMRSAGWRWARGRRRCSRARLRAGPACPATARAI